MIKVSSFPIDIYVEQIKVLLPKDAVILNILNGNLIAMYDFSYETDIENTEITLINIIDNGSCFTYDKERLKYIYSHPSKHQEFMMHMFEVI